MSSESNFFECQKIWDELKDHWYVIENPRVLGSAQACFDIRNLEKLQEIKKNVDTAYELYKLQEPCNDGRGVSCVRQVSFEILIGDHIGAKAITHNDWDKIANYPDVANWLKEKKFAEKDWYVHE